MKLDDKVWYEEGVKELDRIMNSKFIKAVDYGIATLCASFVVYCACILV